MKITLSNYFSELENYIKKKLHAPLGLHLTSINTKKNKKKLEPGAFSSFLLFVLCFSVVFVPWEQFLAIDWLKSHLSPRTIFDALWMSNMEEGR